MTAVAGRRGVALWHRLGDRRRLPAPALAGLGIASAEALWFVPAMVVGLLLHRVFARA